MDPLPKISDPSGEALPAAAPLQIEYESVDNSPITWRPRWVYAIVAIYLFLLGTLLTSPVWVRLLTGSSANDDLPVTIFATILTVCGLALILTPVAKTRRRTVTRRSIWFPIVASGLLIGALVLGLLFSSAESFRWINEGEGSHPSDDNVWIAIFTAAALVWLGWSIFFIVISLHRDPQTLGMKLHRWLIVGSVAELLVAVPTHIVCRRRQECCAGIFSGFAICIGVAVMVISFGPSVYLLYRKRWKQIAAPSSFPKSPQRL